MKTKFLLPVLAAIFAIGMSFTNVENVERTSDPSTDYILVDGSFMPIGTELNCGIGDVLCKVQLEENGQVYEVYDAADPNTLKQGNGEVRKLYQ